MNRSEGKDSGVLPVGIERIDDLGSCPVFRLSGPQGATLEATTHGAQLLSWRDASGRERFFLSPRARLDGAAAIRGGVPVVFPQFSGRGTLPKHGLARDRAWHLDGSASGAEVSRLCFCLADDADTRAIWPHGFELMLDMTLGADWLEISLQVRNTDSRPLAFTVALHGYLAVEDLAHTRIHGLEGRPYEDAAGGGDWRVQGGSALRFEGELDRVYPAVAGGQVLEDGGHRLHVDAGGFPDVVVWNPGPALAAGLQDLGEDQHARFVCIEAAAAVKPVVLGPGEAWTGWQRFRAG